MIESKHLTFMMRKLRANLKKYSSLFSRIENYNENITSKGRELGLDIRALYNNKSKGYLKDFFQLIKCSCSVQERMVTTKSSDVDSAVIATGMQVNKWLDFAEALEEEIGTLLKIDLIWWETAPEKLKVQIRNVILCYMKEIAIGTVNSSLYLP